MTKKEKTLLDDAIVDKIKRFDIAGYGAIFMSYTMDKKTKKPDICTAIFCDDPSRLTQMIYNLIHTSDTARKCVVDALDGYKKDVN